MFKRTVVLSMVFALMLLGICSVASANPNVASVSQKGSLLVWPKIATGDAVNLKDTVVMIGNDGPLNIWVKCYWMDLNQKPYDFIFPLTPNQPVWFSARTGLGTVDISPFGDLLTGELKCFAITLDPESQTAYNFLYGQAILVEPAAGRAFEYPAWAFVLHALPADPTGPLFLNGTNYDYCPQYLVYNFFASPTPGVAGSGGRADNLFNVNKNTLSLSPCYQDLRQERLPVCTKANFDIWNENEAKLTGAYFCIKCWAEFDLDRSMNTNKWPGSATPVNVQQFAKALGVRGQNFEEVSMHTDLGRFRVLPTTFSACLGVFLKAPSNYPVGAATDVCAAADRQIKTPFLGVLLSELNLTNDPAPGNAKWAGYTGSTGGTYTTAPLPQILWDAGASPQPAPAK